jgi:hypothetical protein
MQYVTASRDGAEYGYCISFHVLKVSPFGWRWIVTRPGLAGPGIEVSYGKILASRECEKLQPYTSDRGNSKGNPRPSAATFREITNRKALLSCERKRESYIHVYMQESKEGAGYCPTTPARSFPANREAGK